MYFWIFQCLFTTVNFWKILKTVKTTNRVILDPRQIKIDTMRENLIIALNGDLNPTNLLREILVDMGVIKLHASSADKIIILKIVILRDYFVSDMESLVMYSMSVDNKSHISILLHQR